MKATGLNGLTPHQHAPLPRPYTLQDDEDIEDDEYDEDDRAPKGKNKIIKFSRL